MPRATQVQTNFTAGEISPRLLGRSDLNKFQNGLDEASNVILYPHGMVSRRPGTKYVATTKDSSSARLIPFKYNDDQAYAVEFGDQYLRFYRDGGQVLANGTNTITGASWSVGVATFTSAGHDIGVGDIVTVTGVVPDGYNITGEVTSTTSNQFSIALDTNPASSYSELTITTASWSAGEVTYTSSATHNLAVGDYLSITGASPSGYNVVGAVTDVPTATTFKIAVATDPGTYTSGGTMRGVTASPYQIESPWPEADIDELSYVQSADLLYIFHPNYSPRQIARTGSDVFTVSTFEIQNGPFEPVSQTAKMYASAIAHDATAVDNTQYKAGTGATSDWAGDEAGEHMVLTILDGTFTWDYDGADGITGTHIGRLVKWKATSTDPFYVGLIYQINSATEAYVLVLNKGQALTTGMDVFPEDNDDAEWYLGDFYGSFSDTTHTTAIVASGSWVMIGAGPGGTMTLTTERKHCINAGETVEIRSLESATADVNGFYAVTAVTATTIDVVTSTDPGAITAGTGLVILPNFLTNTAQEGTANDMNQPATGAFYQQRMWLGRTTTNPNRIYASVTGDFPNFQEASLDNDDSYATIDTDALNITIDDDQVNEIRWIRSAARGLLVGTNGAEYSITGTRTSEVITPSNVQAQRQSQYGSAAGIRPELIGRSLLFAHRSATRLIELSYSFEADQQTGQDVSIVSEHLLKPKIKAMAFAEVPVQTMWMVLEDGSLVTFVFEKDQDVLGWTKCSFGGSGLAESVVALPESDEDSVWFVVNRNGTRTIEVMQPPFDTDTEQVDAWYVDNGLAFDRTNTDGAKTLTFTATAYTTGSTGTLVATGHTPFAGTSADLGERYRLFDGTGAWFDLIIDAADTTTSCTAKVLTSGYPTALQATATSNWANLTDTYTGLDHLAGQTVSVFADGGTHEDVVVDSDGQIVLNNLAHKGVAGLGYTSTIKSLPIRVLQYFTETRGKAKALYATELRLWKSLGGEIDFGDRVVDIEYRDNEAALGKAPDLFTGITEMAPSSAYDSEARVNIVNSEPVPFNLLSMVYELDINDQI